MLQEARLGKVDEGLVDHLDVLCPAPNGVQWYARDSAYPIEGSDERHHLCVEVSWANGAWSG